ncbi:MAG TPA: VWA domain-containing protein [Dongiaceae bacterium]|nr:VWA domain-containing protein [Dongiaceae bacterium]
MTPTLPSERVAGFVAHLRRSGYRIGPGEAMSALSLIAGTVADPVAARLGMKVLLSGSRDQWEGFDELFDAYWSGRGLKRVTPANDASADHRELRPPPIWDRVLPSKADQRATAPQAQLVEGDEPTAHRDGAGRLVASRREQLMRAGLDKLADPEEQAEAARLAERLAQAMRYRLSRRRRASRRGRAIDLRRTLRRNLVHGMEPLELLHRKRPDRPVNLILLLDVSGSMKPYARAFLAFARGLAGSTIAVEVFLFHTRLARISDALQDPDPVRAVDRLTLLSQGFGGGTRIAECLAAFNARYAKSTIDSRSVVIVMSDGYDTDAPERLAAELATLKQRAPRLIWLNPLIGWRDYAPVARGMQASLPYIDLFAPAATLADLAALEPQLALL